jgi:hypothetical protein
VGQSATSAGRAVLGQPRSRMIGSVAYLAETYGAHLVPLGMDICAASPFPRLYS